MKTFGSVLTALITPFDKNDNVNFDLASELVGRLKAAGTDTVVLTGTTGESPTLTHEEEWELYRRIVKDHKGSIKIMAGTGSNSTKTAIESTKKAESLGIDASLQVVPYYNKPSQRGMIHHFEAIAAQTSLPIMLYNIPGRTGVNMLPETVEVLSKIKNIVAIKEASGSIEQVKEIRRRVDPSFEIYSGDDALTLSFMKEGAVGVVSVASHIVGPQIQEMIQKFELGDELGASEIERRLSEFFSVLFITSNPTPLKAALRMLGTDVGYPRSPLVDVTEEESEKIRQALIGLGLLK